MAALEEQAPHLSTDRTLSTLPKVLAHALVSRLIFDLAFVLGAVLRGTTVGSGQNQPLPSLAEIGEHLAQSAVNYGDFGWYQLVARRGYDPGPFSAVVEHNWAFFPLHPLIIRLVEDPLSRMLTGHIAFLLSVALLFVYLRRAMDERTAEASILLLIYFPFSFAISQFRPETFLLLFSALALWLAQRGRRWDAAMAAGVAGLAKPNAFLLTLLLLPDAWRERPKLHVIDAIRKLRPSTLAVLVAPASGLIFMTLHLWVRVGDPLAWAKIQAAWGAKFLAEPWEQFHALMTAPLLVGRSGWDPVLLNWLVLFSAAAGVLMLLAKRRFIFAAYLALYVSLTFTNHGVHVMGKHLSTCFPAFVGLALLLRSDRALQYVTIVLAALLTLNGVFGGLGFFFVQA